MANIMLTGRCNQRCEYCFAQDVMQHTPDFMTMDTFDGIVDYLADNHVRRVGLIGGEPTLHPQLTECMDRLLARHMDILLFTNGVMSTSTATALAAMDADRFSVLLNLNQEDFYSPAAISAIHTSLDLLGEKVSLGYTVHQPEIALDFHRQMILDHPIKRSLRLGLASPVPTRSESDFFEDIEMGDLGSAIVAAAKEMARDDIMLNFDCGFFMCMFTTEQLGQLVQYAMGYQSSCSPVVDIDANRMAHCCFPLGGVLSRSIDDFAGFKELVGHFSQRMRAVKLFGNHGQCLDCQHLRRGQCQGWCVGRICHQDPDVLDGIKE